MSLRRSIPILACALFFGCGDEAESTEPEGSTGAMETETGPGSSGTGPLLTTTGMIETDTDIDPSGDTLEPSTCDPRDDECGDDFKCSAMVDFNGDPAFECVPLVGEAGPGELCDVDPTGMMSDTCAAGSLCLSDAMSSSGTCAAFCGPDDACPDQEDVCVSTYDLELPLCLDACDPLDLEACAEGWTCREDAAQRDWYCAPTLEGSSGGHGGTCVPESLGLCDPGFSCQSAPVVDAPGCIDGSQGSGCCAQLCNLDDDLGCPGGLEECLPYYADGEVPPERMNLGVCAVPVGA